LNTSSSAYGWTAVKASAATGTNVGGINGSDVPGYFGVVIGSPIFESRQIRAGFSIVRELTWSPSLQIQITTDRGGGSIQRLNYSIRDNLNQYVPSFCFGYSPYEELRFGAGMSISSTSYQGNDSVALQQATSTSLANFNRFSQINGTAVNLLFTLGGQYDLSENWKIGVLLRSPSIRLWGSTTLTYDVLSNSNGQTTDTVFFDNNAKFQYNQSFQSNIGIAYQTKSFEVEGDIRYHAPVNPYSLISSTKAISTTASTGGAPTFTTQPFSDVINSFNHVINFALGGKYDLSSELGLHAGFFSSYSPVEGAVSSAFRKIDLYGITGGASLVFGNLSASIGGAYEWGTSDSFTIANALNGNQVDTTISVTSLKVLYSVTFKF
jgi:hypothetical protein